MHIGRNVPSSQELLEDMGLELIFKLERKDIHSTGDIHVFQKIEPPEKKSGNGC